MPYEISYLALDADAPIISGGYQSKVIPRMGEFIEIAYHDDDEEMQFYGAKVVRVFHAAYQTSYDVQIHLRDE